MHHRSWLSEFHSTIECINRKLLLLLIIRFLLVIFHIILYIESVILFSVPENKKNKKIKLKYSIIQI